MGEVRGRYITDSAAIVYRPVDEVVVPEPWHRGRVRKNCIHIVNWRQNAKLARCSTAFNAFPLSVPA